MDGLGMGSSTNQAPGTDDLKKLGDNPTGSSVFDASQYAFFGNDVVEEVELGGLEEEDEILSFNGGIGDELSFVKEEVEDSRLLSDVDDLATTFSKLNRDPDVYRNTGPIADRRSSQNSLVPEWAHREELPDWYGQQILDSDAIKDEKAWSAKPSYPEPQRQLHQNHNQQQFPSEPIIVPKSSLVSYPPQGSISPDQRLGHPNLQYHSGGPQMGSPNLSQFPTLQPQLAGMHHGSPQRTGNMPQFRPALPLNNRPPAQWMNRHPGDNSGIMNNAMLQQLPHQNGLMPPQMQGSQNRLQHPMQPPHAHMPGMQPQLFSPHLSRSSSSASYDGMLGFVDPRESRPGSAQGNRPNMRFHQQGFDGGVQRRYSGWPPYRSKYMSAGEIENILRTQLVATHSNDPYVDDYYHQACLAKKSAGAKLKHHFCPNHLRDLLHPRPRTNNEPHAFLQVDAHSLGRVPFSSIRRPRPLLEVDPPSSTKSGNADHRSTDKPLDEEPLLAARVYIEDGNNLLLDVDDIDRFLEFSQLQDGGNQLKQKRQALLESLAVSLQLVDPLAKNGQSRSQDDLIFQSIISLPKGRKLLIRYIQLIFPGSDLMRIVCMAIFRHLRSLFGVLSSDPDIAKTTNKLANVVNSCIHKMDLGPISACLAAVSCSSEQPPLRPLGSPVGDGATTVLKSTLDRASELLRANNFNNAGMALWRASFNEFFNLLMRYCISKYDGIMQSLNSQMPPEFASEISDAAAQAIVREMPIELLRSSFPHIDEQQKRLLMEFLKRSMLGSQKTES